MKFTKTNIEGVFLIEPEIIFDSRGSFFRAFCQEDFANQNLEFKYMQSNISTNKIAGTLRGMHYQKYPHQEVKVVRCINGAVYDVVIDIRKHSNTYLKTFGIELNPTNGFMLYVPKGVAHGYQTLVNSSDVHYMVSHPYSPNYEAGVRFDDPAVNINWPLLPSNISEKDKKWPLIIE